MSNSRKIKRNVKRNVSVVGAAALGMGTMGASLLALPGSAFAATAGLAPTNPSAPTPSIFPGLSNQPGAPVSITVNNSFLKGDTITIPINLGGATSGNGATPAASVTYSALPTITVSSNTSAETTAGDTAPIVTGALTTNPGDSNADQNAGIQDELVLSFGNSQTGTVGDQYTISLSGIKFNAGASSGNASGPQGVYLTGTYNVATANAGVATDTQQFSGSDVLDANLQNYTLTETPAGVQTGTTNNALPNLALTEDVVGSVGTGTYTLTPHSGAFTGTATITAKGLQVATDNAGTCGTGGSSATATASGGVYTFCVTAASTSTTGPGSLTISGIKYSATSSGNPGPSAVTLANTTGNSGVLSFSTAQPAITNVDSATFAGFSADDTAAATAENLGSNGAVVIASDAEYQDALSASYLIHSTLPKQSLAGPASSSSLNPILLNPSSPPSGGEASTAAVAAIRKLGSVTTAYLVGGTSALSASVQSQLQAIQIGTGIGGQPEYLQVIRIAGVTAEQTAGDVAQYPSSGPNTGFPGTPAAYGMYNSGASESPSAGYPAAGFTTVPTAVLADADEPQDALAGSALAASWRLPVLLNAGGQGLDSNAAAAITNDGIKQVIIVGGSLAVSDTVVANLESLGVSVLRVAGTTYTATAEELAQFEVNDYAPFSATGNPTPSLDGLNSGTYTPFEDTLTVGTSRGDAYQDALSSANVLGADQGSSGECEASAGNCDGPTPLLLNEGVSTIGTGTADFLSSHGTQPNASFVVYTGGTDATGTAESVIGDAVFGGTLAQTPALIQAELNAIAAG